MFDKALNGVNPLFGICSGVIIFAPTVLKFFITVFKTFWEADIVKLDIAEANFSGSLGDFDVVVPNFLLVRVNEGFAPAIFSKRSIRLGKG